MPINAISQPIMEKEMALHSSNLAWEIPWTERSLVGHSPRGCQTAAAYNKLLTISLKHTQNNTKLLNTVEYRHGHLFSKLSHYWLTFPGTEFIKMQKSTISCYPQPPICPPRTIITHQPHWVLWFTNSTLSWFNFSAYTSYRKAW